MATLFFILFLLAGYHFVYDAIIAPNLRFCLRYKLFALRDNLINLKIEKQEQISLRAFDIVLESININIHHMSSITIGTVINGKKLIDSNPAIAQMAESRSIEVNKCKVAGFKEINQRRVLFFFEALIINMGAWLLYLFPIVIGVLIILAIVSLFSNFKTRIALAVRNTSKVIEAAQNEIQTSPEYSFA